MIVFGAIDFAAAVARVGEFLGYRVTVCDARPTFATAAAFQTPMRSWWNGRTATWGTDMDGRTVITVLTHDPKFDVPLLEVALRLPVAYVGAMGSSRTHEDRLRKLRELGLPTRSWLGCAPRSGSTWARGLPKRLRSPSPQS